MNTTGSNITSIKTHHGTNIRTPQGTIGLLYKNVGSPHATMILYNRRKLLENNKKQTWENYLAGGGREVGEGRRRGGEET